MTTSKAAISRLFVRAKGYLDAPVFFGLTPVLSFLCCGLASTAVYVVFIFYMRNCYHVWTRESRNLSNIVLIPGLTLLLFLYYRGYKILKSEVTIGLTPVIVLGCLAAVAALLIPSFYSFDLYAYINYGWQQARYHANPYCLLVAGTAGFGTDSMFTDLWTLSPLPYGVLFAHLTRVMCELSGGILSRAMLLFKLTNFVAFALLGIVVYFGAKLFKQERADVSLYLYLWSPLILLHTLSGCHNDILMILPAMVGFFCLASMTPLIAFLSIPLLIVAALIKYVWLIAVPLVVLLLARRHGAVMASAGLLMGLVTAVAACWAYRCRLNEIRWVEFHYNLTTSTNSLSAVIQNVSRFVSTCVLMHAPSVDEVSISTTVVFVKVILLLGFIAVWLLSMKSAWQKRDLTVTDILSLSVGLIMMLACLVSSKFYPWYIIMFFPAALWLPDRSIVKRIAMALSCTQLFAVTFLGHSHVANFLFLTLTPAAIIGWYGIKNRDGSKAHACT